MPRGGGAVPGQRWCPPRQQPVRSRSSRCQKMFGAVRPTVRTTKGKKSATETLQPAAPRRIRHAPTDFSPASERAFVHALAIALLRQTRLALLHVGKEEHAWNEFPQVRATLERWNLLEPGSAKEDVAVELGVRVSKHALSGRSPPPPSELPRPRSGGLARRCHRRARGPRSLAARLGRRDDGETIEDDDAVRPEPGAARLRFARGRQPRACERIRAVTHSPAPDAAIEFAPRGRSRRRRASRSAASRRSGGRHAGRCGRGRPAMGVHADDP